MLSPGFVDIHCHGAMGASFNSDQPNDWDVALDYHLRRGTTAMVPTVMTGSPIGMERAVMTGRSLSLTDSRILGVHLEGPLLHPELAGAHPRGLLGSAGDPAVRRAMTGALIVALAPEMPGALELTSHLTEAGVLVAIGHSGSDRASFTEAVARGLRHATHLWSGQTTMHRDGVRRVPGVLELVLASRELTAEVICDGVHLPPELVQIAARCLGSRLCAVSDATAGAGLPPGSSFTMGDALGVVSDGRALTTDGGLFGSTSTLADSLPFLREAVEGDVDLILNLVTKNPASIVGAYPSVGSLEVGARGDVIVLDDELKVLEILHGGHVVATRGTT
jgi:N-acetylglucosamine-6-phosphate deacetylase